ncbi:ovarian carcinoma antigen [Anaeramoeba flamelloides]|uniref:Ovarian carcinoma antigen n=1 Tax=Anaeramoeba flamelloides TaxID=1746091 RepID=A0ABQ8YTR6_9EUKA|nr:ovarian carcinoma antigen [Anaeramoeba flamelloides]
METICIKVRFSGSIRRFAIKTTTTFITLIEHVSKICSIDLSTRNSFYILKYVDDEGDMITLDSTPELQQSFKYVNKSLKTPILNLYVVPRKDLVNKPNNKKETNEIQNQNQKSKKESLSEYLNVLTELFSGFSLIIQEIFSLSEQFAIKKWFEQNKNMLLHLSYLFLEYGEKSLSRLNEAINESFFHFENQKEKMVIYQMQKERILILVNKCALKMIIIRKLSKLIWINQFFSNLDGFLKKGNELKKLEEIKQMLYTSYNNKIKNNSEKGSSSNIDYPSNDSNWKKKDEKFSDYNEKPRSFHNNKQQNQPFDKYQQKRKKLEKYQNVRTSQQKLELKILKDLTVPENSKLPPNEYFQKGWKIQNCGQTKWPIGTQLLFNGGDKIGFQNENKINLYPLSPSETMDIYIDLKSPHKPGRYHGFWKAVFNNKKFGERFSCVIIVDTSLLPKNGKTEKNFIIQNKKNFQKDKIDNNNNNNNNYNNNNYNNNTNYNYHHNENKNKDTNRNRNRNRSRNRNRHRNKNRNWNRDRDRDRDRDRYRDRNKINKNNENDLHFSKNLYNNKHPNNVNKMENVNENFNQNADFIFHKELLFLQKMNINSSTENIKYLLIKYNGDIQQVINELLQYNSYNNYK